MSSWKKWESKRGGLARWRGRKEEERKGKKKSILLGSGGGNSNWDRERDLSSARDVSRGNRPLSSNKRSADSRVHRYRGICISTEM